MKLADLAVNRPVAITMFFIAVIVLGVVAMGALNLDLLPELNLPMAAVITSYPGSSPEEVERLVTEPLEESLSTVQGVEHVSSISQVGSSMVMLEFDWDTDIDFAALDMREKVDLVKGFLPDDAQEPMVMQLDPTMMPVVVVGVTGEMDQVTLRDFVEDVVKNRLERLDGVAAVSLIGGEQQEIQVLVHPEQLQNYGLSLPQVVQSLQAANMNLSSGNVGEAGKDLVIQVTGEFQSIDEIANLTLVNPQGGTLRLADVADVSLGHKDVTSYMTLNGTRGIGLSIQKQTSANTVEVADRVSTALAELQSSLPPGVQTMVVMDQAEFIRDAINNMVQNLILGAILALLILFLFLRSVRSTVIIGVAIPIAVVATFVLLFFGGMNLNLMTLGGLALGVGMMVDNSIVILENIYRHRQEGMEGLEAAKFGANEVTGAITASTLTTVAVFLPMAFVERGIASELFGPMAITVSFSLLASLLVALTLVPMLASRFLGQVAERGAAEASNLWDSLKNGAWLTRLDNFYRRVLGWCLSHRRRTVGIVAAIFIASLFLIPLIGTELIPVTDQGQVMINVEMPKGAQLAETERVVTAIEKIIGAIPERDVVYSTVGSGHESAMFGGQGASDTASITLMLVPLSERSRSQDEVAAAIREKVADIPGARITVASGAMAGAAGFMGAPVQLSIRGDDLETLGNLAAEAKARISDVPGLYDIETGLEEGRPQVEVVVDRPRAAQYGLSVAQIASAARTAVQGQVATRYREVGDQVDILVRLTPERRQSLTDLENLVLPSPTGALVPLKDVADIQVGVGPTAINRYDRVRSVDVTAQLGPGYPLGEVMPEVQARLSDLPLPQGYFIDYGGQTEMMNEAFGNLQTILILAVILVYMIMAAQFESLLHPFVIMFSIPVAAVGVILSLVLTGRTFNVTSYIGVIMLAGIVVNNAIVLVDYINTLRRRGMERNEAVLLAGPTRLRPVLMTALTTVLGLAPLALGIGEGAEIQAPMATVVIGGLLVSTILTLVLVPVVYTIFDDLSSRFLARRRVARGSGVSA